MSSLATHDILMPRRRITTNTQLQRRERGQRIRQALDMLGIAQTEAAAKLNVAPSTLSRMMTGERIREDVVKRLALMSGVSSAWIENGIDRIVSIVGKVREGADDQSVHPLPRHDIKEFLDQAERIRVIVELPKPLVRNLAGPVLVAAGVADAEFGRRVFIVVV